MFSLRRTALALVASLALLAACSGSTPSDPDRGGRAVPGETPPGSLTVPWDSTIIQDTPQNDTTDAVPRDTTRLGGGSHGSGG
ncbi:MAG TPA: hypothetical protein VE913_04890 [Longimicrobium sp.]|nr:hypothetical protein [Longimicrobium sp.]